jgi:Domain of unknown function (DUF4268)
MTTYAQLSRLERVALRDAWRHEAGDFTPWLATPENLDDLAKALGLSELVLVQTEHWVGDFKLDILCTDGDEQVIIENQLEETDHKHLGQIIAYAAGVGAKKIIWVAESFRPEHISALQFLNENTTENLSFFGVRIELWRIADSPLAPNFEVVTQPNDWTKVNREQARAVSNSSSTKLLQQKFWTGLIEHLKQHAPQIRPQAPRPQHWLNNSIGRAGFGLNITANTREARLGVELYMNAEDAKRHYENLLPQKEIIETRLGFTLDWQDLPNSKACRIVSWCHEASIEEEGRWGEFFDWLTERLVKMDLVLRPIVRALP